MPKVGKDKKLNRLARRVAVSNPLPTLSKATETTTDHDAGTKPAQALSRGQRKRQAKQEQYLKKEKMILSTLMLKKREEQKKRIDGMDAIRDALLETTKSTETKQDVEVCNPTYGSNRAKKSLISGEIERMQLVQQHPAFKEDPFATIQEHLKNTFSEQREKLQKEAQQKADNDKKKQDQRKQEKKERLQGVKKASKKYKTRRSK
jgi:Ribosome biogenesis protein SLX9